MSTSNVNEKMPEKNSHAENKTNTKQVWSESESKKSEMNDTNNEKIVMNSDSNSTVIHEKESVSCVESPVGDRGHLNTFDRLVNISLRRSTRKRKSIQAPAVQKTPEKKELKSPSTSRKRKAKASEIESNKVSKSFSSRNQGTPKKRGDKAVGKKVRSNASESVKLPAKENKEENKPKNVKARSKQSQKTESMKVSKKSKDVETSSLSQTSEKINTLNEKEMQEAPQTSETMEAKKKENEEDPQTSTNESRRTKVQGGKSQKRARKDKSYLPFPKLASGQRFVTKFGVVQVIQDKLTPVESDRTRVLPLTKSELHVLSRKRDKRNSAFRRAYVVNADKLLISRRKMRKICGTLYDSKVEKETDMELSRTLYLDNKIDFFRTVPMDTNGKFAKRGSKNVTRESTNVILTKNSPISQKLEDPLAPADSLPDRIVECFLIPDKRNRIIFYPEGFGDAIETYKCPTMKLYLKRRLLNELYQPDSEIYQCATCGKILTTKSGARAHMRKQPCLHRVLPLPLWLPNIRKRTYKSRDKEVERIRNKKKRERLAAVREEKYLALGVDTYVDKSSREYRSKVNFKNDNNAHVSEPTEEVMYLEVWKALGFLDKKKRRKSPWIHFDNDLTSIYPSVYRSLNFRSNPIRKNVPRSNEADPQTNSNKKKRRTSAQVKFDKEQHRLQKERERKEKAKQIVVDIMVLVEEIDTGRYPSIKRYTGKHQDDCVICKNRHGILYCCEFCKNVCHLECLRERVTIRNPEPDDDFMCHSCILKIIARRSRAEKRRRMKRDSAFGKAGRNPAISAAPNLSALSIASTTNSSSLKSEEQSYGAIPLPKLNDSEVQSFRSDLGVEPCPIGGPGGLTCCEICSKSYSQVLADVSNEMEIQIVSMMGREVSEMIELLKDAQLRAQQAVDLSHENEARRMLLDEEEDSD